MDKEQKQINNEFREILKDHAKHLEIANSEMGRVKECLESIKTDMEWLKKFFWLVATSSVGSLIAVIINAIR